MAEQEPTTANGTQLSEAVAYAGEEAPAGVKAGALLRDAERYVRDVAPPPANAPVPDDYKTDAKDAEMYVFSHYSRNPGDVSSASLDGVSVSFSQPKEGQDPIKDRVERIMSRWIRGTPPRATVSGQRYSNVLTEKDKW